MTKVMNENSMKEQRNSLNRWYPYITMDAMIQIQNGILKSKGVPEYNEFQGPLSN